MFCILQCKGAIDENLTLAENEEDLTNHKDNDICISHVISHTENLYSISSVSLFSPLTMTRAFVFRAFVFRAFLLQKIGSKDSIFNCVSKLNLDHQTYLNTTKILATVNH